MSEWTDKELAQLENEDEWDWENPIVVDGRGSTGATLVVALDRDAFRRVARAAEITNVPLIEFVRQAALRAAAEALAATPADAVAGREAPAVADRGA